MDKALWPLFQFSKHKNILPFIIFVIIGFSLYSNVLHGEFISDDAITIVDNPAVKNIKDLGSIWQSFNTRFLVGLTFALNYHFGQLNTFGYHIVNIIIHLINTVLVWLFVGYTLKTPKIKEKFSPTQNQSIAFFAALVFLCHPVQTQGVAYITQRAVSMATMFYLATLVLYIKGRLQNNPRYLICAFLTMLLGLCTKEMTITIPITLILYEYFFIDEKIFKWQRVKYFIPFFVILILPLIILLQDRTGSILELKNQIAFRAIKWNYFFTEINVLRTYLRMFFVPVNLNFDYDYPMAHGFWEVSTVLSAILLISIFGLALYLFVRNRLLSFAIIWFFVATSVEVAVVSFVNRAVIYDHWLYLPMVGFAIFLSVILHELFTNEFSLRMTMIIIIVVFSIMTYQRNFVWQTRIGFWQDNIRKSPNKSGPYWALGKAYQAEGQDDLAITAYEKALMIKPNIEQVLNNLGSIYMDQRQDEKALQYFQRAIAVRPTFAKAYNNMALLYYFNSQYDDAINNYYQSLRYQPDYPDAYYYLGKSYAALGKKKAAKEHFERALELYREQSQLLKVEKVQNIINKLD